jgi:zinc transporter ZupT
MLFSIQLFAKIATRAINPNIDSSGHSPGGVERYSDENVGGEDNHLSRGGHEKSCPAQPTAPDDCEIHSAPEAGGQNGNRSPADDQKSCPPQVTALDNSEIHSDQNTRGQNGTRSRLDDPGSYAANLIAVLILEFGIIFHSLFIGFNLAIAGDEFITLYIVIIFHQLFEGLALGSRLAKNRFLEEHKRIQYFMALLYGFTTPIAIAIGLGVRTTYAPGSQTALIVNGIFDSISAGILIYTGLVDLMAREFLFLDATNPVRAWGTMCLGAGKGLFRLACGLISSLSVFLQASWPSSAIGHRFFWCLRFCSIPSVLLA